MDPTVPASSLQGHDMGRGCDMKNNNKGVYLGPQSHHPRQLFLPLR